MNIYQIDHSSEPLIAQLMCKLKPEWWDYDSALGQLSNINESIKTIGWFIGEDKQHPKGWIFCRELIGYRTLQLECCGFDDNGVFKLEHKLSDLMKIAEDYALTKGYLSFTSGISSIGFNIHNQVIDNVSKAIDSLSSNRIDYKWYLDNGFKVIGIQPNAYEKGFHLILLGKSL